MGHAPAILEFCRPEKPWNLLSLALFRRRKGKKLGKTFGSKSLDSSRKRKSSPFFDFSELRVTLQVASFGGWKFWSSVTSLVSGLAGSQVGILYPKEMLFKEHNIQQAMHEYLPKDFQTYHEESQKDTRLVVNRPRSVIMQGFHEQEGQIIPRIKAEDYPAKHDHEDSLHQMQDLNPDCRIIFF
ncbi:predicted protein [Coccidioides posadasii str. Silveira]|uniref:Predicted protein n=1 Tax=Coccidioides posadasii (strain RMSCC 757 / Silveira) TaxID=443226 RepID=E9D1V4_COCPS|nr:predicted protein [Coccidioides posadasii str. Silveira]